MRTHSLFVLMLEITSPICQVAAAADVERPDLPGLQLRVQPVGLHVVRLERVRDRVDGHVVAPRDKAAQAVLRNGKGAAVSLLVQIG